MTEDTMERYVAFICEELSTEFNVVLDEPKRLDGTRPPIKKIGPKMKVPVNINVCIALKKIFLSIPAFLGYK
jgi:hypothetical protein